MANMCYRWKGTMPSGILRMEVSLFSGYELSNAPPTIIDPKENIVEMLHGYNGNTLWFIFANITSNCPICVQYLARSVYVISSLRPAYVRMYPAGREDLAAEMFFHTHVGSNLLKGITEDDLITWFGRNITNGDLPFDDPCECQLTCNTDELSLTTKTTPIEMTTLLSASTIDTTTNNTPHYLRKIDEFIVSTYTINVDDNSEKLNATLQQPIVIPTSRPFKMNDTIEVEKSQADEIILQRDLDNLPTDVATSTEPLIENSSTIKSTITTITTSTTTASTTTEASPDLKSNQIKKNSKKIFKNPNSLSINSRKTKLREINKPLALPSVQMESETETTTTRIYDESTKTSESIDIISTSPPKHINIKTHDIPLKYIDNKDDEIDVNNDFPPENKNDKYVLLDKEKLWGLLKEVVYDEMHKKTKIIEAQKLKKTSQT